MMKKVILLTLLCQLMLWSIAQTTNYDIRLNQVGYLPNSVKLAAVIDSEADSFKVMTSDLVSTVFSGGFLPSVYYASSGENVRIADFTLLQTPGEYIIIVDDLGNSIPFTVNDQAFIPLSKASIKAFYFNRASMEITGDYGGIYARPMGHPDTSVVVHPSAASEGRPAGTIISTPRGWYDAGDYNKYVVNSGISTFTLLSAYETYPEYFDTLNLNIPESGNAIPDILDEALWNIQWMMSMQDSADGGVYHKTTEASFSSFSMPSAVTSTRYVTAKSTAATLDFGAIMAMTARIYKPYLPELADSALAQAEKAWEWANAHPYVPFTNPSASDGYPAISTGQYGDGNFSDEFSWCAAELYITTKDTNYYEAMGLDGNYGLPGWGSVKTLGLLSLLIHRDSLTPEADTALAKEKLLDLSNNALGNIVTSAYRIPGDFYYWGGTNAYANWGMLFLQAFRLTENANYFNAAISTLDYLLGRNATTYCFVTGTGTKSPMNIHHRISGADGIEEPIPGMLVGGPGTGSLNDCGASQYPSSYPAKSYVDLECSYSTNEVAINWNAPLAFLSGAVMVEYLTHYIDSMPLFLVLSSTKVELPYKQGEGYQLVIEGNSDWSLVPSVEWITLSDTAGSGSTTLILNSLGDNPGDSVRMGIVYVYAQDVLTDSIMVSQNGLRKSFRIEAEDYIQMSGIQTEATTDDGGGLNIGYVDPGDWVSYNVDITNAGYYEVVFRHAGYAGDFDVSINDSLIQNVTFSATSGWQDWASYTTELPFPEGQHELKFTFNAPGVNLNWMQFDWLRSLSVQSPEETPFRIYPVPASTILNIEGRRSDRIQAIQLLSTDGKILIQQAFNGSSAKSINVSGFKPGIYFLRVISDTDNTVVKIIVE